VTKKVQKIYDEAQSLKETETEHDVELFGGFSSKDLKIKTPEPEKNKHEPKKPDIPIKKESKSQSSLFDF
jgi:hypothetical protein